MAVETTVENRTVKFTVSLENATGRPFHWKLQGEGFDAGCVEGGIIEGVNTIDSTKEIFVILKENKAIRNLKNFRMVIRENGPTGNVVATSSTVTVVVEIITKPPAKIGIIPIRVPYVSGGRPSWSIEQGNLEFSIEDTDRIQLKTDLDRWGWDTGITWFDRDGFCNVGEFGTWGPYYTDKWDDDNHANNKYTRSYWNATGDHINSIWVEDDAARCQEIADTLNTPYAKSCVMPFVLRKEKVNDLGEPLGGEHDFSKLDLVAELTVVGFDEYSATWYNDPVYGHRAYSGPQGNTMIDCPLYKNATPVSGTPPVKELRSSVPTVQTAHVEYFKTEGRGYVQLPLYQLADYLYDEATDKFTVTKRRNGFNARLKLTIKERTTGEVVSGLMFSVMMNDLYNDRVDFMTDRWARQYLRGSVGDVIRITEISPLYWEEPQRWVACDYTPDLDEASNIRLVAYNMYDIPDDYATKQDVPPPLDIAYFNTPEVNQWPELGMSVKSLPLVGSIVGTKMHIRVRPTKLGEPFNTPFERGSVNFNFWEGGESYLESIFEGSITESSVSTWKNKRRRPLGNPEWNVSWLSDDILEIECMIKPDTVDRVHRTTIVVNFDNGWWGSLDADVTRLPGYYRMRLTGSLVTDISLD